MTWQEFAQQDPELAALGQERLDRNGLVMVATLRKNGWPRISPVEPLFHNGQLYLGSRGGTRGLRPKLAGLPHLILELFADERVRRRAFDVHGEAVKFVSDRLVADLLK